MGTPLSRLRASYHGYLALGPGGIPHNILGYLLQLLLRPVAHPPATLRDPTLLTSSTLTPQYSPHGRTSYLSPSPSPSPSPLPTRTRPTVPPYVAPHRQTTETASAELKTRMQTFLSSLASSNPSLLEIRPSGLEGKGTDAVFLKSGGEVTVPKWMGRTKGEIVHVHPEGSVHVTLSLADAEGAMRGGWAEFHPLSGVWGLLPWSYVMVYAPRDDAEFEVWSRLVVAGCRFVCGGRELKVPSVTAA